MSLPSWSKKGLDPQYRHVEELFVQTIWPGEGPPRFPGDGFRLPSNCRLVHVEPIADGTRHGYRLLLALLEHFDTNTFCNCEQER